MTNMSRWLFLSLLDVYSSSNLFMISNYTVKEPQPSHDTNVGIFKQFEHIQLNWIQLFVMIDSGTW